MTIPTVNFNYPYLLKRLLIAAFETPEVDHEENWIQLTLLAYIQLWLTKDLAQHLQRPWAS